LIIGSGIGGLSAGTILAKLGFPGQTRVHFARGRYDAFPCFVTLIHHLTIRALDDPLGYPEFLGDELLRFEDLDLDGQPCVRVPQRQAALDRTRNLAFVGSKHAERHFQRQPVVREVSFLQA